MAPACHKIFDGGFRYAHLTPRVVIAAHKGLAYPDEATKNEGEACGRSH